MTSVAPAPPRVKFDSARPSPAPPSFGVEPWTPAEIRRARAFGLRAQPGQIPAPKPSRALDIRGVRYAVRATTAAEGERVVRLAKADGTEYDVSRGPDGEVRCTCPNFTWKREGTGAACKHGAACVAAGLVEATAALTTTVVKPGPAPKAGAAPMPSRRRGPSAEDRAYESARTIGVEAEGYVAPPAHFPAELRAAWELGMAEAGAIIDARADAHYRDLAMQAEADERLSAGVPWL